MMAEADRRAPMASVPMKYDAGGSVAWGEMWDTFCVLAQEGGPPHRGTLLHASEDADPASPAYRAAAAEIIRGIGAVSGLPAEPAAPGWIAARCGSPEMARWLAEAIVAENVAARADGPLLLVPVGTDYTLGGEIKNVITAVAKTTHYWGEHLPGEAKAMLALEERLGQWRGRLRGWFRGRAGRGRSAPAA